MAKKRKIVYFNPKFLEALKQNTQMSDRTWALIRLYGGSFE